MFGDSALRVVLADDSGLIRGGIARVLQDGGFKVVAEAGDAAGLLRAVDEHRPDIAVVDIRMPVSDTAPALDLGATTVAGIEAAVTLRANHPGTAVLLLSQYIETDAAMKLLAGGAAGVGYLLKDRVSDVEFLSAVDRVAAGGTAIDPILVTSMIERPHRGRRPLDELTARERAVLALMAEGKSNQAISTELGLGRRTVETHISAILDKLGLRPEADDHRRVMAVLTYLRATGT
jgi:DNA-binding NarL/FixJ family response regulator